MTKIGSVYPYKIPFQISTTDAQMVGRSTRATVTCCREKLCLGRLPEQPASTGEATWFLFSTRQRQILSRALLTPSR